MHSKHLVKSDGNTNDSYSENPINQIGHLEQNQLIPKNLPGPQGLEGRKNTISFNSKITNQIKRRTQRVIITNEARVLRDLRIEAKLSMRKAGTLLGLSDSYISHIENGRCDPPRSENLDRFLLIYGGMKQKSFYERVRRYKEIRTLKDELLDLVQGLEESDSKTVLFFIKSMQLGLQTR